MAKSKGEEKPVEKPEGKLVNDEPEIIPVPPAPQGRVEQKLGTLEGMLHGLTKEIKTLKSDIFGLAENPAEETEIIQVPPAGTPGVADSGENQSKDRENKGRYPIIDFF